MSMPARLHDLAGRTILVTRAAGDAEAWAEELRARGARAVVFPCIVSESIRDAATTAALRDALAGADWLALTSARGARAVAEMVGAEFDARIAVVGAATAEVARELLGRVDLVSSGGTGASLGADLARRIRAAGWSGPPSPRSPFSPRSPGSPGSPGSHGSGRMPRVVAAGAEGARRDVEEALAPIGITVHRVAVYRVVPSPEHEPRVDLEARGVDTIFLASPSAVTGLLARADVPAGARIITIGPTTSEAARTAGLPVHGEADGRGLEAMIEAIP